MQRAARGGVTGISCALILAACGGGYGGGGSYGGTGSGGSPGALVTLSVSPTTITAGQAATLTWTSSSGDSCTASGAWSGNLAAAGTQTVTPATAGTDTFTLTCTGGGYSSATKTVTLTVNAATAFSVTKLVADTAADGAKQVDANLVNPWGLAFPAGGGPVWVANNGTQTSTLYDGAGIPQPAGSALVVAFSADAAGNTFNPSGIVANGSSTDFVISSGANSGAAAYVFDGEDGTIAGWSFAVNPTQAVTTYTDTGGAVYKGLAIAQNAGASYLYATDFHNAKVDVFDAHFVKQTSSATVFTFSDPAIPAGYAPFGIQAIANGAGGAVQIYVTYAKQSPPANHDNANGAGLGYVDVYDTNGKLVKQLIAGGALNAPWGLALAPVDFGTLSKALLVGNFGDGVINAYDPASGATLGRIQDAGGQPIATPGLWGIAFGNDTNSQPHNTLFFAAGTNNEANGSYGRIDP